jgi:hypothetical protein
MRHVLGAMTLGLALATLPAGAEDRRPGEVEGSSTGPEVRPATRDEGPMAAPARLLVSVLERLRLRPAREWLERSASARTRSSR